MAERDSQGARQGRGLASDGPGPAEGRGSSLTFQSWPSCRYSLLLLLQAQRAGADAAEDADLVAALVHGPVAVEALRRSPAPGRRAGA